MKSRFLRSTRVVTREYVVDGEALEPLVDLYLDHKVRADNVDVADEVPILLLMYRNQPPRINFFGFSTDVLWSPHGQTRTLEAFGHRANATIPLRRNLPDEGFNQSWTGVRYFVAEYREKVEMGTNALLLDLLTDQGVGTASDYDVTIGANRILVDLDVMERSSPDEEERWESVDLRVIKWETFNPASIEIYEGGLWMVEGEVDTVQAYYDDPESEAEADSAYQIYELVRSYTA